jgi:hypothetical protein
MQELVPDNFWFSVTFECIVDINKDGFIEGNNRKEIKDGRRPL